MHGTAKLCMQNAELAPSPAVTTRWLGLGDPFDLHPDALQILCGTADRLCRSLAPVASRMVFADLAYLKSILRPFELKIRWFGES